MISTNGGCRLPCWWGITPGVDTWQAVENVFTYLRTGVKPAVAPTPLTAPTRVPDRFTFDHVSIGDNWCYADVSHELDEVNLIQSIELFAEQPAMGGAECAQALRPYFLDAILIEYGRPSRVIMQAHAVTYERNAPLLYDLWLYFDDLGILAYYQGEHGLSQGVIRICPQYASLWAMNLRLQPPGTPLLLEETGTYFDKGVSPDYIRPIEDVSDLPVETFYEKYAVRDVVRCFDTPAELWQEA